MENVFIVRNNENGCSAEADGGTLNLVLRQENFEIMQQHLCSSSTVWVTPAEDSSTVEFFCVISGELLVCLDDGRESLLSGDSFYVDALKKDLQLYATCDTEILYVTNRPMFDIVMAYRTDFESLLVQINEKDNVTHLHSRNVLRYMTRLFEELGPLTGGLVYNEMATAALFHDIGKCFIPDEVLKKQGALTPDEWRIMKTHPSYSGKMLLPRYGKNIADVANQHHERLDGSGYPEGLSGDEICLGARIVAVADAFDAMISYRPYSAGKDPLAAAKELCSMPEKYDSRITAALLKLQLEGKMNEETEM